MDPSSASTSYPTTSLLTPGAMMASRYVHNPLVTCMVPPWLDCCPSTRAFPEQTSSVDSGLHTCMLHRDRPLTRQPSDDIRAEDAGSTSTSRRDKPQARLAAAEAMPRWHRPRHPQRTQSRTFSPKLVVA